MSFKHPFQIVLANKAGTVLFTTTQNKLQVFSLVDGSKLGEWVDEIDFTEAIKKNVIKEQERQKKLQEAQAQASAEAKDTDSPPKKKAKKEFKVPVPGPGAPKIFNYIRNLHLTADEKKLICTTDSDKAAVIFDLDLGDSQQNVLKLVKRQAFPKRPSAISTSNDDANLVLGDKFGDVYTVALKQTEQEDINGEKDPILGHVSMLTDLAMGTHDGKEYIFTCDRDEHIRVSNYPQSFVIEHWLFGHEHFVSSLVVPTWNPELLISGGGDDFIFIWDWFKDSNQLICKFNYREVVAPYLTDFHKAPKRFQNEANDLIETCVSKIVSSSVPSEFIVLVEGVTVLLFLRYDKQSKKIELVKLIDLKSKIISITSSNDLLFAAIENKDELISIIDLKTKEIVSNKTLIDNIKNNSNVEISSEDELYPLYPVCQLRKRSEH